MADSGNERWLVLTVETPSDALKDAVTEGLLALGGTAVQVSEDNVSTYVRVPADTPTWLDRAETSLRAISGTELRIDWHIEDSADWSQQWKHGLGPRRVGRRLIVTPSWSTPEVRAGDMTIVVDPEMAFGTGEHATTRAALRFLEQTVEVGDRVLDVGTGSAILAIGATKLGATRVIAIDNDPDAMINARDNLVRNGVADSVTLEVSTADTAYLSKLQPSGIDIIVANVISSVLVPLLPAFFGAVRPGGHVILGGILEEEADEVLAACAAAGFDVIAEDLEEEWWAVLLRHPPAAS